MADDYRTTEVGERYAQALFDLADETGALEAVRADLASLRGRLGSLNVASAGAIACYEVAKRRP